MIRHWFSHRCRFPGYVLVLGELFRDRLFQLFFQIGFGFRITSVFTVIILLTIILIIIRCFMFLFLLHCRRVAKFLHRHSVAQLPFHILVVVVVLEECQFPTIFYCQNEFVRLFFLISSSHLSLFHRFFLSFFLFK
uniref:Uncharacterized protein n=1 Tax=Cacopsylla melanoneura TaxID=428564 RepID=A0A8D8Q473_9HEMI